MLELHQPATAQSHANLFLGVIKPILLVFLALDSHPRFSLYKGHILESSLTSHRVLGRKELQAHDEEL